MSKPALAPLNVSETKLVVSSQLNQLEVKITRTLLLALLRDTAVPDVPLIQ
jgi:hypothetical protein